MYIFFKKDENNSDSSGNIKSVYGLSKKKVLDELEIIEDKLSNIRKYLSSISDKDKIN